LNRTERQLLEVALNASPHASATTASVVRGSKQPRKQPPSSPQSEGVESPARASSLRQTGLHEKPSAGGPFAGPRGMHRRADEKHWSKSRNEAARDTYNYLGPGSDGDPGPEIHPLWS